MTALAVVALLVATAFVAWIARTQGEAPSFKEVRYTADSPDRTTLDFDLTKEPEATVTCAVQAVNDQRATVGWKEVTIGRTPGGKTTTHHVEIRTTSPANTATVDSCWVADR